jgi:hypothetical protein
MTSLKSPLVSDEYRDEVAAKGRAIYENELGPLLEPEHDKEYVVIHVDNGDYAVGKSMGAAMRELLKRHPVDGRLIGLKIGNEPEYGLAARLLAADEANRNAAK